MLPKLEILASFREELFHQKYIQMFFGLQRRPVEPSAKSLSGFCSRSLLQLPNPFHFQHGFQTNQEPFDLLIQGFLNKMRICRDPDGLTN